jgi:hypothetical protein
MYLLNNLPQVMLITWTVSLMTRMFFQVEWLPLEDRARLEATYGRWATSRAEALIPPEAGVAACDAAAKHMYESYRATLIAPPAVTRRGGPGMGSRLRDLFKEKGELSPSDAYRLLRLERRTSYQAVLRLFYDLRRLGLIEFVRAEPSPTGIEKRYYRIAPGMEDDPRWIGAHHRLFGEVP